MSKSLVEMAADLVQSQCGSKSMSTEEISAALQSTFKSLQALQTDEARIIQSGVMEGSGAGANVSVLGISPEKSIQKNKVICLECGLEFKMISPKHLKSHGLTGREYRSKWGFSLRQPLCAKSLSDRRKKAGKERGLPENLRKSIDKRKKNKKSKK